MLKVNRLVVMPGGGGEGEGGGLERQVLSGAGVFTLTHYRYSFVCLSHNRKERKAFR